MKNIFIVDRIEGEFILCEDENRNMVKIKISDLNFKAHEGDILIKDENEFSIDYDATKKRKMEIDNLMKGMWIDE